jgi:class 3 adenylate cyclase
MLSQVSDEPPPIRDRRPDVPEALAAIVHRALEKSPHARHADANELLADLEAFWHGDPVSEDELPQAFALAGTPIVYDNAWALSSSPAELWPHVSNTERFNRAIGLDDVEWMSANDDGALRREGELRSAGMLLRWKENPFEWVAPHRLGVVREYSSGPFEWLRSMVWLEPHAGGTHLHHRIEIRPRGLVGRVAAGIEVGLRMKRAMERVYRHIDESCRRIREGQGGARFDPFEETTELGPQTLRRLDAKLNALVTAGADPYVVEALGRFVRTAPAPRLGRIRPRELARELDLDESLVLEASLRAAHEGLLVVLWDVLCPSCRIPSSIAESLQRLADHGRCEACDLDFELDLARSVELVFRVHPEIREADLGVYCIGGPAHSPHVLAQVRLPPGQRLALALALEEGSYRIAGRGLPSEHAFRVHPKASLSSWDLPVAEGLPPSVARSLMPGSQHISLTNDLDREVVIRVENASERSDAFTAADAAAHPLFRELFPNELLSPAQLIGVSKVALLFAESGEASSRFEADDRESYVGLSELLARVREAAELEGGALVKLHGDAVLAVFTASGAAVRAALRLMRAETRASVHAGPAMVATIQERLDYFGRTVQVGAAMAQLSGPGELLVSEEVQKDEVAAELLRARSRPSGVVLVGPVIATRQRCA